MDQGSIGGVMFAGSAASGTAGLIVNARSAREATSWRLATERLDTAVAIGTSSADDRTARRAWRSAGDAHLVAALDRTGSGHLLPTDSLTARTLRQAGDRPRGSGQALIEGVLGGLREVGPPTASRGTAVGVLMMLGTLGVAVGAAAIATDD